jgi:threonine/homoserine/homoserine lactone efflux protein
MDFFLKGLVLGFAIAAPVGPVGILCIRRALAFGRWSGLSSGLGAAFADMLYGCLAVFGLTILSNFLIERGFWLRIFGGIFLIFLGARTFFAPPAEAKIVSHITLIKDFVSTFMLTLTNPLTVFSYIAIFAGLGLSNPEEHMGDAISLIAGVFFGSSCWWLILSEGVSFFSRKVGAHFMTLVNRVAGCLIIFLGLATIVSILFFK